MMRRAMVGYMVPVVCDGMVSRMGALDTSWLRLVLLAQDGENIDRDAGAEQEDEGFHDGTPRNVRPRPEPE